MILEDVSKKRLLMPLKLLARFPWLWTADEFWHLSGPRSYWGSVHVLTPEILERRFSSRQWRNVQIYLLEKSAKSIAVRSFCASDFRSEGRTLAEQIVSAVVPYKFVKAVPKRDDRFSGKILALAVCAQKRGRKWHYYVFEGSRSGEDLTPLILESAHKYVPTWVRG